ncbi:cytochrome-c oxidase, cbb3-type subunit III [Tropicibacter naphthalenivorans]|uniref:Cbb3-type cytochrome c oxidase subunit n=1 Tax=Tropicibacter naphthalenivorans TaxID=441103 RepID=A0A0N7LZK3_9RHOB|nr:cytochrome-c oxidase, cbb3-type subunit III [Tropicibacter naphthalenivorans]CUH77905.1 Cytochrome c oxidase subunit III [Tropicibacter naphthalenivorans]SMC95209.1 cytochrome c oxidase cbb3-type subunit 3 [Tropicibacter naphthalenivorans]
MSDNKKHDEHDYPTTGHEWDGIREYDKPMPRWWLYTFYACIIWGIGYTIAYPAWPGIKAATPGLLGFSTRGEVAEDIARVTEANAGINQELVDADMVQLASATGTDLNRYAQNAGKAVFNTWCIQCHQTNGAGAKGYPALLDDDWLWGGTIEDIQYTIAHGIRNETDDEARYSEMPAFGRDELLASEEVDQVVNYVMTLSGAAPQDASLVEAGQVVFEDNCAACHAEDGTGDRFQGAPNLADQIWLYGGSYEDIHETVWNARYGVMPNWNERLSEAEIRAVATYVHGLGGGEATE